MASFLIETYAPGLDERGLADVVARAAAAADSLRTRGTEVEHVRSYLVSEDELCLHVFEGRSQDGVRRVASLAGIEVDRVVETVGTETRREGAHDDETRSMLGRDRRSAAPRRAARGRH